MAVEHLYRGGHTQTHQGGWRLHIDTTPTQTRRAAMTRERLKKQELRGGGSESGPMWIVARQGSDEHREKCVCCALAHANKWTSEYDKQI
jgi:hypothetical protein